MSKNTLFAQNYVEKKEKRKRRREKKSQKRTSDNQLKLSSNFFLNCWQFTLTCYLSFSPSLLKSLFFYNFFKEIFQLIFKTIDTHFDMINSLFLQSKEREREKTNISVDFVRYKTFCVFIKNASLNESFQVLVKNQSQLFMQIY